jgi:SH3-like domain-containing protein
MTLSHILCFLTALTVVTPLMAQNTLSISTSFAAPDVGQETKLPLPRYVSLKAKKANVRRGPGLTYRIDWVFQRRRMPLQIIAEYGHWRRVIDSDDQGGWVHYVLLSGIRTVIVKKDLLALRTNPSETAYVRAKLEENVIARLHDCQGEWCELTADGYTGWAHKSLLWGVGPKTDRI